MLPCKMDEKKSGMGAKTLHHRWLTCQLLVVKKSGRCVYESVLQEKKQTHVVSDPNADNTVTENSCNLSVIWIG